MNCEVKHQLYSTGFVRDVQSESHPQHSTGYTLGHLITSKRSIIGFCSSLDLRQCNTAMIVDRNQSVHRVISNTAQ